MVNQELVRQLLKELEAEKGCPVQLTVEVPSSVKQGPFDDFLNREYFGSFAERPVSVKRVANLVDMDSMRDVRLIEGDYATYQQLRKQVDDLNVLHRDIITIGLSREETPLKRAVLLIEKQLDRKTRRRWGRINTIARNCTDCCGKYGAISQNEVEEILHLAQIPYLKSNLRADFRGVYDASCRQDGSFSVESKVADITFKLVE